MGKPFTDAERLAFIAQARRYVALATRWRHQGRSERGVDCGGLVAVCLSAIGCAPADMPAYSRWPLGDSLRALLVENFGEPVPCDSMQPGDVVLMRFGGEPSHVAMLGDYVHGGLSVIHAYAASRKVVEHALDDVWLARITEVFRP